MNYRAAVESDLPQIAAINLICVPNGLRAAFGLELTTEFFRSFFRRGNPFVVADDNGQIAGFVMGYYKGDTAREEFESKNEKEIMLRFRQAADAGNPAAIRFFAKKAAGGNTKNATAKEIENRYDATLMSAGVLPAYTCCGVGKTLVRDFLEMLRASGNAKTAFVETQTSNIAAQRMYTACGYQEIQRDDASVWYGMVL